MRAPIIRDLPMLMFSAKKITPEKAQPHCLNIGDFVSKPVNPAQLPDAIKRVFEQRANVNVKALVAKEPALTQGSSKNRWHFGRALTWTKT